MSITKKDKAYIWHPLTQHHTAKDPIPIVKAKGALLYDEDGKTYIDGIASWYTSMYGHGNPTISNAIQQQMQELDFVMFSGFTHKPATQLADRLMQILPDNQQKIFFNDNGSTAVEAAIKMALQFYHNKGEKRDTIIAFENGFHGDTFGAMSASGIASYNGAFTDFLLKVVRIPTPQEDNIEAIQSLLQSHIDNNACAAFIFEPLVQGAAGMQFHTASGLDALIKQCQAANILCIADEIMTGFGKTGTTFASDQLEHKPDIICLSKALTAGMFPLSITSCSQAVFDCFLSQEVHKGFFHAHTYSAHPLGCAAATAGIDLLLSPQIQEHIKRIHTRHSAFAKAITKHPKAKNVRIKGVILAFELDVPMQRYGELRQKLYDFFMDRGICLRPLGNTIYVLPPYIISEDELNTIYKVIEEALDFF